MPKKKTVQCPLKTLTYMFAWPSTSGKRAQTISSTLCAIPWDTDCIHLQGITALPLACLFCCHFCAVGGFQQAAGSPVIQLGCTFGESTKTETSQICLISSAYLATSSFLSVTFVFSPKIRQSAPSSRVCFSMYLRERNWKQPWPS